MSDTGNFSRLCPSLQTKLRLQSRVAFTKSPLEDFLLPVPQEDSEDDTGGGQNVTNWKR